jgi:hypothetical protein
VRDYPQLASGQLLLVSSSVNDRLDSESCSPQKYFARLESRIVVRDLEGTASTAEGLVHHEGRVELAQDHR